MQETEEWLMVVELMDCLDDMTDEAAAFIKSLHDNLDPYEPFLDQMEGLDGGVNQEKWLRSLYEKHMNEDEEAARDIYDAD
jgi:hypothetical protein